MKVKIKLVDASMPAPEYKTKGAVGFDLYLRKDEIVLPGEVKLFPSNLIMKVPKGHFLLINPRSSTPHKFGLLVFTGIIDQDYCGEEDEFNIQVMNITKKKMKIERGTRIAQGILIKMSHATFTQVKKMGKTSRGGFGTTGHK